DSTVIHNDYFYNKDSIINCTFGDSIKYQYRPFIDIKFTEKDFLRQKRGEADVYYSPMRITFSKILYTNDGRALVYAKIYQGKGRGKDIYVYGFVFKKNNDDWILNFVDVEVR